MPRILSGKRPLNVRARPANGQVREILLGAREPMILTSPHHLLGEYAFYAWLLSQMNCSPLLPRSFITGYCPHKGDRKSLLLRTRFALKLVFFIKIYSGGKELAAYVTCDLLMNNV